MQTQPEQEVALIILHAVDTVQYGKHKRAGVRKGARAKERRPTRQENVFGGLLWHTISTIEGFIEQLETIGLIERRDIPARPYPFPVYVLTDAGRKVIEKKMQIPLQVIKREKPITVGGTEKQTFELFKKGNAANDIAKIRGLVESTIYTHFYRLIVNGHLSSSDVISEDMKKRIEEVCSQFDERPSLTKVKEKLPQEITYEQIRCVAAEFYGGKDGN